LGFLSAAAFLPAAALIQPPLSGTPTSWRKYLFTEHTFHTETTFKPLRAVTDGRWKLIRKLAANPADVIEELYDTQTDSDERNNLADLPAQQTRRTELSNAVQRWQQQTNDPLLDSATFNRLKAIPTQPQFAVAPWYTPVSNPGGGE
jgi:arylsulfatase A-like enzyme